MPDNSYARAKYLFDNLAAGMYYGTWFRSLMQNDPEVLAAVEVVNAKLLAAGMNGLLPDSKPKPVQCVLCGQCRHAVNDKGACPVCHGLENKVPDLNKRSGPVLSSLCNLQQQYVDARIALLKKSVADAPQAEWPEHKHNWLCALNYATNRIGVIRRDIDSMAVGETHDRTVWLVYGLLRDFDLSIVHDFQYPYPLS